MGFMLSLNLCVLGEVAVRGRLSFCLCHLTELTVLMCLSTSGTEFGPLVEVSAIKLLSYKIFIFLLVINKYLVSVILK